MKLSLCMIVKNEEKNISTCIHSVQSIVSEIIVVDSGSTDRTIEIAEQFGAKVFHFEWVDDFSKARNYAISKAKGDWIIFLDADEYLVSECLPSVIPIIKQADKLNAHVIASWHNNYEKDGNKLISSAKSHRILKRHPKIRYKGAIHESLAYQEDQPLREYDAMKQLQVNHTGYSVEEREEKNKAERNLNLLFLELEKDPNNGYIHFYIAESYAIDRKYEDALQYALQAANLDNFPYASKGKNYRNIINYMIVLAYPNAETKYKLAEALLHHPNYPDLYYLLGNLLFADQQYFDAIEVYEKALANIENTFEYQSNAMDFIKHIYTNLAQLYRLTEQLPKSVQNYVQALKFEKYNRTVLSQLLRLLKVEPPQSIMNFLGKIYDLSNTKDQLVILQASILNDNKELSSRMMNFFTQSQQAHLRKEEAYIQLLFGKYEQAMLAFKESFLQSQEEEAAILCIIAADLGGKLNAMHDWMSRFSKPLRHVATRLIDGDVSILGSVEAPIAKQLLNYYIRLGFVDHLLHRLSLVPSSDWQDLADALYHGEYYEQAMGLYNQYLENVAELTEEELCGVLVKMGNCLYQTKQVDLSLQFFDSAQQLDSSNYQCYERAIVTSSKLDNKEQFAQWVNRAYEYFPDSPYIQQQKSAL